jgi:hypothetical protein
MSVAVQIAIITITLIFIAFRSKVVKFKIS